tara:strand:- start:301 stop:531 length:231 start_codon:yes stop_codon:yes gene_type:complete
MRALIFNTEQEAKEWDWDNNSLSGSITRYKYSRKPLSNGKYALLVGADLDTIEGETVTPHPDVVDVSGLLIIGEVE